MLLIDQEQVRDGRPDLVDPPGLAGDMASGRPEAVLQQEIPVI